MKELQAFRAKVGRLTQDWKDGRYQRVEAYLEAVDAVRGLRHTECAYYVA